MGIRDLLRGPRPSTPPVPAPPSEAEQAARERRTDHLVARLAAERERLGRELNELDRALRQSDGQGTRGRP